MVKQTERHLFDRQAILTAGDSSGSSPEPECPSNSTHHDRTDRTLPPLALQKPLPPCPPIHRRVSSTSPPHSPSRSASSNQRSSSDYSHTVSPLGRDDLSWHSEDFADPPLAFTAAPKPVECSASAPELGERQPSPSLLQPRTYAPCQKMSSNKGHPAASNSTPAIASDNGIDQTQTGFPQIRTVSLKKAIAAVHSPGAEHLLPEELRAREISKLKFQTPLHDVGERRGRTMERALLRNRQSYNSGQLSERLVKTASSPRSHEQSPASLPVEFDKIEHLQHSSPYGLDGIPPSASDAESDRRQTFFPAAVTLSQGSRHRRTSTSGSIPISPPLADPGTPVTRPQPPPTPPTPVGSDPGRPTLQTKTARTSDYYPHVTSRKGTPTKKKSDAWKPDIPPMPFLSDLHKESSRNAARPNLPPLKITPAAHTIGNGKGSALSQRLARGVAKYADLLTRAEAPDRLDYAPITAATVSPGSPQLLSGPGESSRPKDVHLGWSELAKTTFDKIISPRRSEDKVAGSALQERHKVTSSASAMVSDSEDPRGKSGLLSGLVGPLKGRKQEKRREELKKIIRVIPMEADDEAVGGWV